MFRTCVHSELYSFQAKDFQKIPRIDEVFRAIEWAVSTKPEQFAVVVGTASLRILLTEGLEGADVTIPCLRVAFTITDPNQVELLAIGKIPTEEELENAIKF
jgi:hypothetical protein